MNLMPEVLEDVTGVTPRGPHRHLAFGDGADVTYPRKISPLASIA